MNRVWAPWRMEYLDDLHKGLKGGCVFCHARDSKDDRNSLVLFRGKRAYIVLNRYPYINGHLLIIPNDHKGEIKEMDGETHQEIFSLAAKGIDALKAKMGADGFNCGINVGRTAGAGIPEHFHFHVVPRWAGDHNFFPILGETKSISEYLEKTYDRLLPGF